MENQTLNFVILSNAYWDSAGGNSSQQFAHEIIRRGWPISYVQRDGSIQLEQLSDILCGADTIVMCDMPCVDHYWDLFCELKSRGCRTVYRIVDHWDYTPLSQHYRQEREEEFILAADVVFASNALNISRFKNIRGDIQLLPNGVDLLAFRGALGPAPLDLIFGEVTVAFSASFWDPTWIDWEALKLASESLPHTIVNIIGVVPAAFRPLLAPNVNLLGRKAWTELPLYLRHCDLGLLPYNPLRTRYNNPLKVLEYLAAGLPVVACNNESLRCLPYVSMYDDHTEIPELMKMTVKMEMNHEKLYMSLAEHSWSSRLDTIIKAVGSAFV